jgi:Ni,Fe-hydrogenase maturation factor
VPRNLRLQPRPSKFESEQAAARHIVARQREYQQLKVLAQLAGVPINSLARSGDAPTSGAETPTAESTEQFAAQLQRWVTDALDRRRRRS